MIDEQVNVTCVVPVFTVCGIWTSNQNCQCLNRSVNPVKMYSRVQESSVQIWMFNGRPLYKHYGLWWKFQPSGRHFYSFGKPRVSLMRSWAAVASSLWVEICVLFCLWVVSTRIFRAVSWHQSRATDLKVGVKGCDQLFMKYFKCSVEYSYHFTAGSAYHCKWHLCVVKYPNSLILNLFIRNNSSVVFVVAVCVRVRSVGMVLLFERREVSYNQFLSRKI